MSLLLTGASPRKLASPRHGTPVDAPYDALRVTPMEQYPVETSPGVWSTTYALTTFVGSSRHAHATRRSPAGVIDFDAPVQVVLADAGISVSVHAADPDGTQGTTARLVVTGVVAGTWQLTIACGGEQTTIRVLVQAPDPVAQVPLDFLDDEWIEPSADKLAAGIASTITSVAALRSALAPTNGNPVKGAVYVVADGVYDVGFDLRTKPPQGSGKGYTYLIPASHTPWSNWRQKRLTNPEAQALGVTFRTSPTATISDHHPLTLRGSSWRIGEIKLEVPFRPSMRNIDRCYWMVEVGDGAALSVAGAGRNNQLHRCWVRSADERLLGESLLTIAAPYAPTVDPSLKTLTVTVKGAIPTFTDPTHSALTGSSTDGLATRVRFRRPGRQPTHDQSAYVTSANAAATGNTYNGAEGTEGAFGVFRVDAAPVDNGDGTFTMTLKGSWRTDRWASSVDLSKFAEDTVVEWWHPSQQQTQVGVKLAGAEVALVGCRIQGVHSMDDNITLAESKHVACYAGPGPIAITNNAMLGMTGEGIIVGGAAPPQCKDLAFIRDVHIARNLIDRQGQQTQVGGGFGTGKNGYESKTGQRFLIERLILKWQESGDLNQPGKGLVIKTMPHVSRPSVQNPNGWATNTVPGLETSDHVIRDVWLDQTVGVAEFANWNAGDGSVSVNEGDTHDVHLFNVLSTRSLRARVYNKSIDFSWGGSATSAPLYKKLRNFRVDRVTHFGYGILNRQYPRPITIADANQHVLDLVVTRSMLRGRHYNAGEPNTGNRLLHDGAGVGTDDGVFTARFGGSSAFTGNVTFNLSSSGATTGGTNARFAVNPGPGAGLLVGDPTTSTAFADYKLAAAVATVGGGTIQPDDVGADVARLAALLAGVDE